MLESFHYALNNNGIFFFFSSWKIKVQKHWLTFGYAWQEKCLVSFHSIFRYHLERKRLDYWIQYLVDWDFFCISGLENVLFDSSSRMLEHLASIPNSIKGPWFSKGMIHFAVGNTCWPLGILKVSYNLIYLVVELAQLCPMFYQRITWNRVVIILCKLKSNYDYAFWLMYCYIWRAYQLYEMVGRVSILHWHPLNLYFFYYHVLRSSTCLGIQMQLPNAWRLCCLPLSTHWSR